MSIGHFLYLPVVFLVGMAFGYVLGGRAVRREIETARNRGKN
jgi:hypothetical protein